MIKWFKSLFAKENDFVDPIVPAQYPAFKYDTYWEKMPKDVKGGVGVEIRLYSRTKGFITASSFEAQDENELNVKVNEFLKNKLEQNKVQ